MEHSVRQAQIPRSIAATMGVVVAVGGAVVLTGWILNLTVLQSGLPGLPTMAPATAGGFVLAGTALWCLTTSFGATRWFSLRIRISQVGALGIALLGLLKLAGYFFALNLDFDMLGFDGLAFVAPATAIGFLLIGCALFLASSSRYFVSYQAATLGAILVGWLGIAIYLNGGGQIPPYAQMALHTSLLLFLLSIGTLCVRTDGGLMALLTSGTSGARVTLWLLFLAPLLLLFIKSLEGRVGSIEMFGSADPTPLFAVLDTVLLAALIWASAAWLSRAEARRAQADMAHDARLELFVEYAPAAIAMVDREMRYIAVSRRWLEDYRLDDQDIIGQSHYELFPEIPDRWKAIHQRCLAGAVERSEEDPFPRADGKLDWVRWEIRPWHAGNGEVDGLLMFSEVITARKEAEGNIRRLNRVYAMLSRINSLIVRVRDTQELFHEVCRIAVDLGGFGAVWIGTYNATTGRLERQASAGLDSDDPLFGYLDISHDGPSASSIPALAIQKREPVFVNDLASSSHANSEIYQEIIRRGYHSVIAFPLLVDGFVTGTMSMWAKDPHFFDDDELRLLTEVANDVAFALKYLTKQEELDYLSYYDVLTGLPNRSLFLDRLQQRLRAGTADSPSLALLIFSIERFRNVNETLGRHGGDEVLRTVARRLKEVCDERDNLARIGADIFALAIRGVRDPIGVAHVIERKIFACFKDPYTVFGTEIRLSAKVGLALFPVDGRDADTLFRNAEAAQKEAKKSGANYLFYATEMNAQAADALTLDTRLRKAIETKEFVLYYQPKYKLENGAVCGLEALIRWQHPELGLRPPGEFIPMLEETGMILEVGRWALQQAMADYANWSAAGLRVPRIAVNVSPVQLRDEDFLTTVIDLIEEAGVSPEALELEITESLIMQDVEENYRALSVLRGMGIQVAMDDFGTGYSSLRYLARLPIDKIKIDRSFVAGMLGNKEDRIVVATIVMLAHSFGLPVIAEGVETPEQEQALRELRCDEAQGFLFSRPVSGADTFELLGTTAQTASSS